MRTMHLLESAHTGHTSTGMHSFLSVSAHVAIVAAALYATTRPAVKHEEAPDSRVYFVPEPRRVVQAAGAPAPRAAPRKPATPIVPERRTPAYAKIPVSMPDPHIDLPDPSPPMDAAPGAAADNVVAPVQPGTTGRSGSYAAGEVEIPAAPLSKSGPDYPERAIRLAVSGSVMAQFVVGANGRVERDIVILDSTSPDFTSAVETFLRRTRFSAARVGGRPVRQMVEQRFVFELRT